VVPWLCHKTDIQSHCPFLILGSTQMADLKLIGKRPVFMARASVAERVTNKILGFVETFISGVTG
tara:strand:+ start:178 stop:372 length:195 start_codon:yes stop_codon:yes gene_type:complete